MNKRGTSQRSRITAFGASSMAETDPRFIDVVSMAEMLARTGWDAVVGGDQGMMTAFSQGIRNGGGHVRGITLECFPTPSDNHLSEEIRARDFFHRMQIMIENTDAYIALPGGLGTLAELSMTWDLLAIGILTPRPLILYGDGWHDLLEIMRQRLIMSVDHAFNIVHECHTSEDVLGVCNDCKS